MASYLKIAKGFAEQKVVCYYCQFLWQSSNFQPPNMLKLDKLYFSTKMCRWISCGVLLTLYGFISHPTPVFFSLLPYQIFFFRGKPFMEKREHKQKMEGREGARGSGASESESSFKKNLFWCRCRRFLPSPFILRIPTRDSTVYYREGEEGNFCRQIWPSPGWQLVSALFACIQCFTSLKCLF